MSDTIPYHNVSESVTQGLRATSLSKARSSHLTIYTTAAPIRNTHHSIRRCAGQSRRWRMDLESHHCKILQKQRRVWPPQKTSLSAIIKAVTVTLYLYLLLANRRMTRSHPAMKRYGSNKMRVKKIFKDRPTFSSFSWRVAELRRTAVNHDRYLKISSKLYNNWTISVPSKRLWTRI